MNGHEVSTKTTGAENDGVDLYWLPLGAGGHFVRWNGRLSEALVAQIGHRATGDLHHSALEVHLDGHAYVIESAQEWSVGDVADGTRRHDPLARLAWDAQGIEG